jgi:serine/threonine protein kinase
VSDDPRPTVKMAPLAAPPRREIFANRYELLTMLGTGGMATVYLARDLRLERLVAVKVLTPGVCEDHVVRFHREATLLAAIESPYVVPVYDLDATPQPYLVMRYIEGRTLAQELETATSPLDPIATAIEMLRGLHVLHRRGVVHRDLKPSNVMRQPCGQIVLLDLGVARDQRTANRLTQPGTILGTPAYMSPEQAAGESGVDTRSDIYQMGWLLAHLVIGSRHKPRLEDLAELPMPFREVVERALGARDTRYRDAEEMIEALT